jgi:hypothetical protein
LRLAPIDPFPTLNFALPKSATARDRPFGLG